MVDPGPGNANLGAKVFFIWGGCCFVCIFFVWGMIYETKGLALEQVDELYAKVPHAWQSQGFVPSVSFQDVQQAHADTRHFSLAEIEQETTRKRSVQYTEGDNRLPEKNLEM
jgi:SP family sugar:H+ symporter-like MFS transporter